MLPPSRTFALGVASALTAACAPVPAPSASRDVPAPVPAGSTLRTLERELVPELNRARTAPREYATVIGQLIGHFQGTLLSHPWFAIPVRTQEGERAVREAVSNLQRRSPLPALLHSDVLARAAKDLAEDQSRTGRLGHTGSDGSSTDTRVRRYGSWSGTLTENIAYQPDAATRPIIVGLIVDDGVPSRGHRTNIFDPAVRYAGSACAPHPRFGTVCVMVHAGGVAAR